MTSEQSRALLERIIRFDTTVRQITLEPDMTVIKYDPSIAQWGIVPTGPGDLINITIERIPVVASEEELLPILSRIPAPGAEPADLTDDQIKEATALIFDTVGRITATVFDGRGLAISRTFDSLTPDEQQQGVQGLKVRIENEGLRDYIDRKRPDWGSQATDRVIEVLSSRGLLTG